MKPEQDFPSALSVKAFGGLWLLDGTPRHESSLDLSALLQDDAKMEMEFIQREKESGSESDGVRDMKKCGKGRAVYSLPMDFPMCVAGGSQSRPGCTRNKQTGKLNRAHLNITTNMYFYKLLHQVSCIFYNQFVSQNEPRRKLQNLSSLFFRVFEPRASNTFVNGNPIPTKAFNN